MLVAFGTFSTMVHNVHARKYDAFVFAFVHKGRPHTSISRFAFHVQTVPTYVGKLEPRMVRCVCKTDTWVLRALSKSPEI